MIVTEPNAYVGGHVGVEETPDKVVGASRRTSVNGW